MSKENADKEQKRRVLVDIKGIYRDKIHSLKYWSL